MQSLVRENFKKLHAYGRRVYRSLYFSPFVLFIAMMFVTFLSYRASILYIQRDQQVAINNKQIDIARTLSNHMGAYEQILLGGAGLFRASENVTEQVWHNYISAYDITRRYPGVQTIGYVKQVPTSQLPSVVAYMKGQGFSNFTVTPKPTGETFTAVLYMEPNRQSKGQGLDLSTSPERRNTMHQARDSGEAALTPPTNALLNTTDQPVTQMYVAEYDESLPHSTQAERERALRGYVFASFRLHDFFNALIPTHEKNNEVAFRVAIKGEGTDHQTFYTTPNWSQLDKSGLRTVSSQQNIELYGQTWVVSYLFNADLLTSPQSRNTPLWTLIAGSIFSILLAEVIYLLLKARARELASQRDQAVDLAKDELLSLASHQLRTPATTVKQYLGMILQGFAGDVTNTQEKLIQKAYDGNERQLRIINEMLHIAKIDSGRITLAKQPTDLTEFITEIVTDFKPEIEKAGHKLRVGLPKRPVIVDIDEHMLRMAIENLLSNAVKYTIQRGKLRISLRRRSGFAYIAVEDNGVGIATQDMSKLYKLFTRLNNKHTQTVSGTGVGLYLAKHLVRLHGGSIETKSTLGKGSIFTIKLPYSQTSNNP